MGSRRLAHYSRIKDLFSGKGFSILSGPGQSRVVLWETPFVFRSLLLLGSASSEAPRWGPFIQVGLCSQSDPRVIGDNVRAAEDLTQ